MGFTERRLNTGIYEIVLRLFSGNGDRFVRLFRETVARIPECDSQVIDAHWFCSEPIICLETTEVVQRDHDKTRGIAIVDQSGHRLRFSGPALDAIPDSLGCAAIAHELAHIMVFAADSLYKLPPFEEGLYRESLHDSGRLLYLLEWFADDRARAWGFDMMKLREWVNDYMARRSR